MTIQLQYRIVMDLPCWPSIAELSLRCRKLKGHAMDLPSCLRINTTNSMFKTGRNIVNGNGLCLPKSYKWTVFIKNTFLKVSLVKEPAEKCTSEKKSSRTSWLQWKCFLNPNILNNFWQMKLKSWGKSTILTLFN